MTVRIADVVAVVSQLSQEWVAPAEVAQELAISTPTAGRLLADAARDGLLSRRRLSQWKVIYRAVDQ